MPIFNHPTFGDIQSYIYTEGTILKVYVEDSSVPEAKWDTVDVEYENHKIFTNALVRYHCLPTSVERSNGAIVDGAKGFDVGDQVICMAKIGTTPGKGEEYEKMYVVAHRDGICPCTFNYLFLRISASELIDHKPPYGKWVKNSVSGMSEYQVTSPGSHTHEYCTVWDVRQNRVAKIYNPITKQLYSFPVTVEEFKPAFDYYRFDDQDLFTMDSQGDEKSQEAGFTPDWTSDFQGEKIRAGASPDSWWTTYDIFANPIFSLLYKTQIALATDDEGVSTGKFTKAMKLIEDSEDNIEKWKNSSPLAFNDDKREFPIKGSDETKTIPQSDVDKLNKYQQTVSLMETKLASLEVGDSQYAYYMKIKVDAQEQIAALLDRTVFQAWAYAHDKDNNILKGNSYHMQTAYGEDEVWVCAKNTFMGMVVSWCDSMWKFIRMTQIPPVLAIGNPAADKLATGGGYTPATQGLALGDISTMLASSITTAQDNNIFSWATLKRFNHGMFHRTTHPALKKAGFGSWRATMTRLPSAQSSSAPQPYTAINTRFERIDVSNGYDNWMNTMQYSCATWAVDRTWWFKSNAMQWRMTALFLDTPLGSMFQSSPVWEVAIWYMSQFRLSAGDPVARRDAPINTHITTQNKHNKRVICQIYIVQRQSVSMWNDPELKFVRQIINKGVYDTIAEANVDPEEEGK